MDATISDIQDVVVGLMYCVEIIFVSVKLKVSQLWISILKRVQLKLILVKISICLLNFRLPSESEQNFKDSLCSLLTDSTLTHADTVFLAGNMKINLLNLDSIASCYYMSCLNSLFYLPTVNKATIFANNHTR